MKNEKRLSPSVPDQIKENICVDSKESEKQDLTINDKDPLNLNIIGQLLKEKREEKLLSVEFVSKNLCLQKLIIKSIEEGNLELLPHIVYVKGYIRIYAELLGISDKINLLLAEKQSLKDIKQADNMISEGQNNKDKIFESVFLTNFKKFSNLKLKNKIRNKIDKTIKVSYSQKKISKAMFIYPGIIVLILGIFIFYSMQENKLMTSKLEKAIQVTNNENDNQRNIPDMIDTKKLMITCHERTWISTIIDNTEKKEFMLNPQEIVMFSAKEKFDLLIGNAGGVKLILNGKDTGFSGESGEVKRVTLP